LLGVSVEEEDGVVLGASDGCWEGDVFGDTLGLVDGETLGEALGTATFTISTTGVRISMFCSATSV